MIFPSEVAPVIAAGCQRMMPDDYNEPLPSSMNSGLNRVQDFIIGVCWAAGGRVLRFRSLMQQPLRVEQDEPNAIRNIHGAGARATAARQEKHPTFPYRVDERFLPAGSIPAVFSE